jgi:pilus assembly protein CpaB
MRRPRGTRQTPARLLVLGLSIVAGGVAAYLAAGAGDKAVVVPQVVHQISTVDVLVAKSDISLGQSVTADKLEWQAWPQASVGSNLIRRAERPDAATRLVGSIARMPFIAGEPIRDAKLVSVNDAGFMAAILPSGMRAVSISISPETGAGGFILPNDRVDVFLSKRDKTTESVKSQTILGNVRVLAIDQVPKEKDGQNAVLGKTATLEVSPEQAELLAGAHMSGTLSLALRSITDSEGAAKADKRIVAIYRGVDSQTTYTCRPVCDRQ